MYPQPSGGRCWRRFSSTGVAVLFGRASGRALKASLPNESFGIDELSNKSADEDAEP
jgi:hypothetical protein